MKVILIGAHPPTIGGVSIHVQRLRERLIRAGWTVEVFDPYSRGSSEVPGVFNLRNLSGLVALLRSAVISPAAVCHIHLSHVRQRRVLRVLCFLLRRSKVIFTVHSGSFPERVGELSRDGRADLARIFRCGSAAIAVNDSIGACIRTLESGLQVRTIPAYLSPGDFLLGQARSGLIASGYGTPIYGWDTILDAYRDSGSVEPLHLAFYNTYEPRYFEGLLEKISGIPGVVVHRDLAPAAFLDLLRKCRVFVRATDRDGDSVAVREALALGLEVLATDVVDRPAGCVLFSLGDRAALSALIAETRDAAVRPVPPDFFLEIENLYGAVVAERA
jgi:glycogen(starch) synthase